MIEYVCLTLLAEPGETEAAFKSRLTALWSHMLKTTPDDYERIYSEAVDFEREGATVARRYTTASDQRVTPIRRPG